jgi:hypothetical protein
MGKTKNLTQIYGYLVCLVSIIVFLTCITSIINAVIDKTDPLYSTYDSQQLATFEVYKLEQMKSFNTKDPEIKKELPSDAQLRNIYNDIRQEKINRVVFQSNKSIIVSSSLILLCIILFWTHWRVAHKNFFKIEEES